jgi:hypothetical protein
MLETNEDVYYTTDEVLDMFKLQDDSQRKFMRRFCLEPYIEEWQFSDHIDITNIPTHKGMLHLWSVDTVSRFIKNIRSNNEQPFKLYLREAAKRFKYDNDYEGFINEWCNGIDIVSTYKNRLDVDLLEDV